MNIDMKKLLTWLNDERMDGVPFEDWTDTNGVLITRDAVQTAVNADDLACEEYIIWADGQFNENLEPANYAARRVAYYVKMCSDEPINIDFGVWQRFIDPLEYEDRLKVLAAIFLGKETIPVSYAGEVETAERLRAD